MAYFEQLTHAAKNVFLLSGRYQYNCPHRQEVVDLLPVFQCHFGTAREVVRYLNRSCHYWDSFFLLSRPVTIWGMPCAAQSTMQRTIIMFCKKKVACKLLNCSKGVLNRPPTIEPHSSPPIKYANPCDTSIDVASAAYESCVLLAIFLPRAQDEARRGILSRHGNCG